MITDSVTVTDSQRQRMKEKERGREIEIWMRLKDFSSSPNGRFTQKEKEREREREREKGRRREKERDRGRKRENMEWIKEQKRARKCKNARTQNALQNIQEIKIKILRQTSTSQLSNSRTRISNNEITQCMWQPWMQQKCKYPMARTDGMRCVTMRAMKTDHVPWPDEWLMTNSERYRHTHREDVGILKTNKQKIKTKKYKKKSKTQIQLIAKSIDDVRWKSVAFNIQSNPIPVNATPKENLKRKINKMS